VSYEESWRRDPSGIDRPHDVLAADEFGIGTPDRRLPPDPHRFEPPHDILAAEEFPMPAGGAPSAGESGGGPLRTLVPVLLCAALAALLLRRRRR